MTRTVPGPVKNFEVIKKSSTHFEISWKRPAETNGILYGYELTVQGWFQLFQNHLFLKQIKLIVVL